MVGGANYRRLLSRDEPGVLRPGEGGVRGRGLQALWLTYAKFFCLRAVQHPTEAIVVGVIRQGWHLKARVPQGPVCGCTGEPGWGWAAICRSLHWL